MSSHSPGILEKAAFEDISFGFYKKKTFQRKYISLACSNTSFPFLVLQSVQAKVTPRKYFYYPSKKTSFAQFTFWNTFFPFLFACICETDFFHSQRFKRRRPSIISAEHRESTKCQYCKSISINVQTNRCSSKGRPFRTDARSRFAVYSVPALAPSGITESCTLVMEDPGATNNFLTHTFAEGINLPSRPLALSRKVLGNKMVNQDTRDYNLILKLSALQTSSSSGAGSQTARRT